MPIYTLRFEAAHFDRHVFDIHQLSAIRGASLSYLYSGELVESVLEKASGARGETIFTGASQGAFQFEADKDEALAMQRAVEAALNKDDPQTGCHSHLAYVTALVEGAGADAQARAESLCGVKKLQGGGLRLPDFVKGARRPGGRSDPRPAEEKGKSAAVKARETFGRELRQRFYKKMLDDNPGFDFTDDFHQIVGGSRDLTFGGEKLPPSPQNKIAVFYADGNKLNAHRKRAGAQLNVFSDELKVRQKALLKTIVEWFRAHRGEHDVNSAYFFDDCARFETLMWGGDEVLFVLPSWLGLEFASLFFDAVADWKIRDNPVTFSAGLAICDRKTPIRQAKAVAQTLAELNKKREGVNFGTNSLQIEIFESIALPDVDFQRYRQKFYCGRELSGDAFDALNGQLALDPEKFRKARRRLARLKRPDGLPRSQLYNLLEPGASADNTTLGDLFGKWRDRTGAAIDFDELDLLQLGATHRDFHLNIKLIAALWDYVTPEGANE